MSPCDYQVFDTLLIGTALLAGVVVFIVRWWSWRDYQKQHQERTCAAQVQHRPVGEFTGSEDADCGDGKRPCHDCGCRTSSVQVESDVS